MTKYKNAILIIVAVILIAYACFISIVPAIATNSFNIEKFQEKCYEASSLITTVGSVRYQVKPNFTTYIYVENLSLQYIDKQPLFDAKHIEIETTPSALFGSNFNLKNIYMKNVKYEDQILPNNENKLAFLPGAFTTKPFGKNSITVTPCPIQIKNLTLRYIGPTSFRENIYKETSFTKGEVKDFLSPLYFSHVKIK